MKNNDKIFDPIHYLCTYHRNDLAVSESCGCFHCCEIFCPSFIEDWTDNEQTALCPKCGIDAILPGSECDMNKDLLKKQNRKWFCKVGRS